jgi:Ca2+-binding RTX toxin-like protein
MAVLFGTNGADNLFGGISADTIYGAGGNDTLNGSSGNDKLYGDFGDDSLRGSGGLDSVYGGEGNDTLDATGLGNDSLFGGIGNDVYQLARFGDKVIENLNQGIDTIQSNVSYTLGDNIENLILMGYGLSGTGNNLNNQITGGDGSNILSGLAGNDTLNGGPGNDTLTGGFGTNQFLFDTPLSAAGVDIITDFYVSWNDKILLDKSVFQALETVAGNPLLAEDYSIIDVDELIEPLVAADSFSEIVYNRSTGNLFYNANNASVGFGAGGGQFATITFAPPNLYNTFLLVIP